MSNPRGTTLIELLVALALGATLSAAMVTAYADSRRHHFYTQEVARLQENGRHALRLLTRELAMAGFQGGIPGAPLPPPQPLAVDCAAAPWALAADTPLDVVDDWAGDGVPVTAGGQTLTCLEPGNHLAGTDLLVVRRVAAAPAQFLGEPAATLTSSVVPRWYLRVVDGIPLRW